MRTVRVYSRPDCGICEEALGELRELAPAHQLEVTEIDVSGSPGLEDRYGAFVPVVELDGTIVCELGLDRAALLRRLGTFST